MLYLLHTGLASGTVVSTVEWSKRRGVVYRHNRPDARYCTWVKTNLYVSHTQPIIYTNW